jgi:hypothetical protein
LFKALKKKNFLLIFTTPINEQFYSFSARITIISNKHKTRL